MNAGFVNVGTGGNTAALAVESVRRWWRAVGKDAYPGAARLLVTCDSGGGNGYKNRAWKAGLSALAQETGLDIEVCHFPPGTCKVEQDRAPAVLPHQPRLAGPPPDQLRRHHRHHRGRHHENRADRRRRPGREPCPTGTEISDEQMDDIEKRCLTRGEWHGEWNYTLLARPAPPGPPRRRPAARPVSRGTLNSPALTGIRPADLKALAAALEAPYRAHLDHKAFLARGRRRASAARSTAPHALRRTDVTDNLIITRLRDHLGLPCKVIAALYGIDPSSVSRCSRIIRKLLTETAVPLPPPACPPPANPVRTLGELREHAARHGIEVNLPPPAADTSPHATLTAPRRHLFTGQLRNVYR